MNEIIQWVIVAIAVAVAIRFLVLRFKKKGRGCACDGNCSACNIGMRKLDDCGGNRKQR